MTGNATIRIGIKDEFTIFEQRTTNLVVESMESVNRCWSKKPKIQPQHFYSKSDVFTMA